MIFSPVFCDVLIGLRSPAGAVSHFFLSRAFYHLAIRQEPRLNCAEPSASEVGKPGRKRRNKTWKQSWVSSMNWAPCPSLNYLDENRTPGCKESAAVLLSSMKDEPKRIYSFILISEMERDARGNFGGWFHGVTWSMWFLFFLMKRVCVWVEGFGELRCPAGGLAVWATQAEGHWHAAGSNCPVKCNELCKLQLTNTTELNSLTHTLHTRVHTHTLTLRHICKIHIVTL